MNTCKRIAAAALTGIFAVCSLLVAVYAIGSTVETIGQRQDEQRACLRGATNGLDIERCK